MKIVVLDGYTENPGDLSWEELKKLGECTIYDRTPSELAAERIGDADAVFTNKVPVTSEIIERCPNLKFIGVLATGYNIVDIETAAKRGIPVCNVPAYSTDSVAQFTMGLILELCHHIGAHSASVFAGAWEKNPDFCFWNYPLVELKRKKLGIIGYGKIGQRVAQMAMAFGMEILAYSHHPIASEKLCENTQSVSLEELFSQADFITLHCPLTKENAGIINKDSIAKMKDGVMLINTARGPLICESDLHDALVSGKVAGAAVDVVSQEPIRPENPLLRSPNLIMTPHIAWAPKEARQRLMDITVGNFKAFLAGNVINQVNG